MREAKALPVLEEPVDKPANLSPGMATLLRGGASSGASSKADVQPAVDAPTASASVSPPESEAPLGPAQAGLRLALVGADLLFIGLAIRLAWAGKAPMGWTDTLLCIAALSLGAALSCLAIRLGSSQFQEKSQRQ